MLKRVMWQRLKELNEFVKEEIGVSSTEFYIKERYIDEDIMNVFIKDDLVGSIKKFDVLNILDVIGFMGLKEIYLKDYFGGEDELGQLYSNVYYKNGSLVMQPFSENKWVLYKEAVLNRKVDRFATDKERDLVDGIRMYLRRYGFYATKIGNSFANVWDRNGKEVELNRMLFDMVLKYGGGMLMKNPVTLVYAESAGYRVSEREDLRVIW